MLQASKEIPATTEPPAPTFKAPDDLAADDLARELLNENPNISAATFLNLLKSKGLKIVDAKLPAVEADSSSSAVATARDQGKKESQAKRGNLDLRESIRFSALESSARDDGIGPTRYRVALIQEGLGNLGTNFYYTREALESAITIFEGKKMYADHPDAIEEQARPERSVRDIVGYFENVCVEEVDSEKDRVELCADLILMPDKPFEWVRGLVREAVEFNKKFPDKDFVGLSINASGDAEEISIDQLGKTVEIPVGVLTKLQTSVEAGNKNVKVVRVLKDAVSCDLVTEPGAGGKVIQMLEKEKRKMSNKNQVKAKTKEADDTAHDDEDKDKELIKSMLKKGGVEVDEAGLGMAKEAFQAYREMGMEAEEAGKMMCGSMKLAKHMAAKKEAEEKEAADKAQEDGATRDASIDPKGGVHPAEAGDDKEPKESVSIKTLRDEVIVLRGILAKFQEKDKKVEISSHLEAVLTKSGLPRSATKLFRESIGDCKTTKEIDEKLKLFVGAYESAKGSETFGEFLTTEKVTESKGGGLDFSDCVKN